MKFSAFLSLVAVLFSVYSRSSANDCRNWFNNYSAIELSLLQKEEHFTILEEAFFPDNKPHQAIIDIEYWFLTDPAYSNGSRDYPRVIYNSEINRKRSQNDEVTHRVLRQTSSKTPQNPFPQLSILFKWLDSPIHLFINPNLLEGLSLFTHTPSNPVKVKFNFLVPCSQEQIKQLLPQNETACRDDVSDLKELIHLTSNLRSYALHRSSIYINGIPEEDKEKGYAVYCYNSSKPNGYCILGDENSYDTERIILGIAIGLLLLFIALGSPLGFYTAFRTLHDRMVEQDNMRYFVWSIAITSFLTSVLIVLGDLIIFSMNIKEYPHDSKVFVLFVLAAVLFGMCLPADMFLIIMNIAIIQKENPNDQTKDIPIPIPLIKGCGCSQSCTSKKICPKGVALFLGNLAFVVFLQLCGFHVWFVTLGIIATPVNSLSMLCLFVTFYLFLIAFVAILLKMADTEKHLAWVVSLLIGILGIACIASVITFYYMYIKMVENYNYNSGVLTIIGNIAPSVIATFLAFCGGKLVIYMKKGGLCEANQNNHTPPVQEPTVQESRRSRSAESKRTRTGSSSTPRSRSAELKRTRTGSSSTPRSRSFSRSRSTRSRNTRSRISRSRKPGPGPGPGPLD